MTKNIRMAAQAVNIYIYYLLQVLAFQKVSLLFL